MLSNYFKMTFRALRKQFAYSALNIIGMALGMASCLLILLYIVDQTRFDQMHGSAENIYRLVETQTNADGSIQHDAFSASAAAPALVDEYGEITESVRFIGSNMTGRVVVQQEATRFYEDRFFFVDPSFSSLFDFTWLSGNPDTGLLEPYSTVLTESGAAKYFGEENPLGKTIEVERSGTFTVTGVLKDPPLNSHLDFLLLFSHSSLEAVEGWRNFLENWDNVSTLSYVLTAPDFRLSEFEQKLGAYHELHKGEEFGVNRFLSLQPLTEIHSGSTHIENEFNRSEAGYTYLYLLGAVAIFIILIASINYMNLATARSSRRAREISIRKTVGAVRSQIISQFLLEAIVFAVLADLLAGAIVQVTLPLFNAALGTDIALADMFGTGVLLGLVLLPLITGLFAGSYPALFLARLKPVTLLAGGGHQNAGSKKLRGALVVAQYSLSIVLIAGTLILGNQLDYIANKDLGFNQDELVVVDINSGVARSNFITMKNSFAAIPAVSAVSTTSRVPGDWKSFSQVSAGHEGSSAEDLDTFYFIGADSDFLSTFEIELQKGRNFSADYSLDSATVLLNASAALLLGIEEPQEDPIFLSTERWSGARRASEFRARVIGIIEDFNYKSLHLPVEPLIIGSWHNPIQSIDYFTARVHPANLASTVDAMAEIGAQIDPDHPFEYNFLADRVSSYYDTERSMRLLFNVAAALAIIIACVGLFGLAAYTAERRAKEIGVRKVMGATVFQIVVLLTRQFAGLVGIALILAIPISYLATEKLLSSFAFRAPGNSYLLLYAGVLAMTVALLTVMTQAVRSAFANPVESLRSE